MTTSQIFVSVYSRGDHKIQIFGLGVWYVEIRGHDDKVGDKTENRGRDRCTGNRGGGAVKTETGGSNKGKRKYVMIFPSATTVSTATDLGQFTEKNVF